VLYLFLGAYKHVTTDRSVGKDTRVKKLFFVFALCLVSSVSCASKVRDAALVPPNLVPDWSLYDIVGEFNEYGIAAVAGDSGWAYVDTLGQIVAVPFVYDNGPDPFVEGLARYVEAEKMGFFDERGQRLITAQYDFAQSFSQGLAAVCVGCRRENDGEHYRYVGGQWGYIDGLGNEVIPLQYEAVESFADGRARVQKDGLWTSIELPAELPRWIVYRGFLPTVVLQHPLLDVSLHGSYTQFYLDIDRGLKAGHQIIVHHRRDMEVPKDREREVEVTGFVRTLSLGGAEGTKESYKNEVLTLTGWRYVGAPD
jgi:hypothetical protein